MTPTISIVIPTFNRSDVIKQTLESVQRQTFCDYECIIVDDGSQDVDTLKAYLNALGDARFRLIEQLNSGASTARNRGIEAAKGRYIALLDSDDLFEPMHLEDCVAHLTSMPSNVVVYGRILVNRGHGRTFVKPHRAIGERENVSEYLLSCGGFMQTSTLALDAKLAKKVGFSPGLKFGQDTDFAIRLAAAGASFQMLDRIQAIWTDTDAPGRVSSSLNANIRKEWLDSVDSIITRKARRSDEGWHVAKCYFKQGRRLAAIALYLRATLLFSYSPKLAARIAVQIFVPTKAYRKFADAWISGMVRLRQLSDGRSQP